MEKRIKKPEKTSINNLTSIFGDIKAEDDLVIYGKVKGNVETKNHDVFIGPSGKIKGNIYGKNVKIQGQMKGEIHATGRVEISRDAKFSGEVQGKSVSVEKGAHFDANVDLGRKPLEKAASEERPKIAKASEKSKVQ